MLNMLYNYRRNLEEQIDSLIKAGFEPNEWIYNELASVNRRIAILEAVGA